MFRRLRRPVTHAATLWILVGVAAGTFVTTMAYISLLAGIRDGVTEVFPPKSGALQQEQLPSLFGTVTSVEADGLTVDSKQPYRRIAIDAETQLTTVGGGATTLAEILPGAIVTATGREAGAGTLAAVALVVLEHGTGEAQPASLLDAPSDWQAWLRGESDDLVGWGSPDSDIAFVLRSGSRDPDAASLELYGRDGGLRERIELKADGLTRLKKLNPYLTVEEADAELRRRGVRPAGSPIVPGIGGMPLEFLSASGKPVELVLRASASDGYKLRADGREIVAVPASVFQTYERRHPDMHYAASFWRAPEGDLVVSVLRQATGELRDHLVNAIDLKALGVE